MSSSLAFKLCLGQVLTELDEGCLLWADMGWFGIKQTVGGLLLFPLQGSRLPCDCVPNGHGLWMATLKRLLTT